MSKSIGKILGISPKQNIDKNSANIIQYTGTDGRSQYYLKDDKDNIIYDLAQKNYIQRIREFLQQQSLRPYDNYQTSAERIKNMKNNKSLFLNIDDNPNANYNLPIYTIKKWGEDNVNDNIDIIEKYAKHI